MNEQQARGLAAELAHHAYYRVVEVKLARPTSSCPGDWCVLLQHRSGAERYLIAHCDTPEQRAELAEVLAYWGERLQRDWPNITSNGLRWYWPGEGEMIREWQARHKGAEGGQHGD